MGSSSLTWIIISVAAFVAIVTMSLNSYVDMLNYGNVSGNTQYIQTLQNISSQSGTLDTLSSSFQDLTIGSVITGVVLLAQSLIVYGFGAIKSLIGIGTVINEISNAVQSLVPGLDVVFWFVTFAISFYIIAKFIQVVRGQPDEV